MEGQPLLVSKSVYAIVVEAAQLPGSRDDFERRLGLFGSAGNNRPRAIAAAGRPHDMPCFELRRPLRAAYHAVSDGAR